MRTFSALALIFICLLGLVANSTRAATDQTNPHGALSVSCHACHTTEGWSPLRSDLAFDHSQTRFPLQGRHESVACASCHASLVFSEAGTSCRDCHSDIHRGQFAQNACEECHTPAKWNNQEEMRTRHQKTRFPLIGVHASLDCQQCHADGEYVNLAVDCRGCHLAAYQNTTAPKHADAGLSTDCQQCHSLTALRWAGARFNHDMISAACFVCHEPDYNGTADPEHTAGQISHECTACHTGFTAWRPAGMNHAFANAACFACHATDYSETTNPNHAAGQFSHDCTLCHTGFTGWRPASFDHNASAFPLTGSHVTVTCAQCHVNGQFAGTPTDCWSCHQTNYQGVSDPNHVAGSFDHDCTLCHTTSGWTPAAFDHAGTAFPLTGAHVNALCAQCHVDGQYDGTTTECFGCHQTDYNGATNPEHAVNQYPHDCAQCHSTAAWQPASFDHNLTQFPLTGAHTSVSCALCHANGQFSGTPADCWSCHQTNYQGVQDPNHVAGNFNHDCTQCHSTDAWSPASFDHSGTSFPLTGAHLNASCAQCHVNGQFQGTPTDCWSCHQANYGGAPNHEPNQYPHDCTICHSTTAWQPSSFNHNNTSFPLLGAHNSVNCAQCHVNGQFQGTPTDCWSCHQNDYNNVGDPNHVTGQFSHNCLECHSMDGWEGGGFDHVGTDFPLTGAHVGLACNLCHASGQYNGLPSDCWSCHQSNFEGVQDPNHVAGSYNHDCTQCHTTNGWSPATFDHSGTNFPLSGAHLNAACVQCHVNGQYQGTPTECFFCHQNDYNNATNPNHQGAGFPTTCAECHGTSNWTSTWNHLQYFPIYSGHHAGRWDQCSDCHPNPNNYSQFTCLPCHTQSDTDPRHTGVPGYVYESNACYACHPTGGGDIHRRGALPNQK